MQTIIPFYSFQRDPEYFPDPEIFDPNRFKHVEGAKRTHFGYMPFAEGPRNCIGMRFGMMQAKIGLAKLVQNFYFKLDKRTGQMKYNTSVGLLQPDGGVFLEVDMV